MPNPFPGVNPFIEATADLWVGFHNALITFMSVQPLRAPGGLRGRPSLAKPQAARQETCDVV
jgi:hypothetical protein